MLLNTPSTLAIARYLVKLYGPALVNCPFTVRRRGRRRGAWRRGAARRVRRGPQGGRASRRPSKRGVIRWPRRPSWRRRRPAPPASRSPLPPPQERKSPGDTPSAYEGQTALHIAVVNRDQDMVKFLVAAGADIRARAWGGFFGPGGPMHYGEYPLSFAACTGQKEVVAHLKRHGAAVNRDRDMWCAEGGGAGGEGGWEGQGGRQHGAAHVRDPRSEGHVRLPGGLLRGQRQRPQLCGPHAARAGGAAGHHGHVPAHLQQAAARLLHLWQDHVLQPRAARGGHRAGRGRLLAQRARGGAAQGPPGHAGGAAHQHAAAAQVGGLRAHAVLPALCRLPAAGGEPDHPHLAHQLQGALERPRARQPGVCGPQPRHHH
ncbi:MAG: hypothetical protein J3K34DRAFT_429869, partial [Monoraphidium minutum]